MGGRPMDRPLYFCFQGGIIRPGEPVGPIILTHHLLRTNPFTRLKSSLSSLSRRRLSFFLLKHIQIWQTGHGGAQRRCRGRRGLAAQAEVRCRKFCLGRCWRCGLDLSAAIVRGNHQSGSASVSWLLFQFCCIGEGNKEVMILFVNRTDAALDRFYASSCGVAQRLFLGLVSI